MSISTDDGRQVVARGKIRVDARRALAKLREHLLVDLHLYATEIARAAVASKATTLDIDYDSNDVILTFDGQPVAPNELPRLLDHVLGDGQTTDRSLRGLALGVNAALGLGPAFVDIYVRPSEHEKVAKVRFVPSVLESEDVALPEIEWGSAPKGMPGCGMRVHVRRRMGVQWLKRAAARELPREIALLSEALHSAPLTLTSQGTSFSLPKRPRALLRVPIQGRELRRGVLEILEMPAGPVVEWLELGVTLLRKTFVAEPILPGAPHAQVELPIRVVIDANELPTNASRSALREDAPLPKNAEQGAREALILALRTLVALVTRKGKPLPNVDVVDGDVNKLETALGAIVCIVAGAHRRGTSLSEQAMELLDLPLLQNAVGASVTPYSLLLRHQMEVYVHQGKDALEADLAPWLDNVVWLRGKMAERMLVDFAVQDAKTLVAAAMVARERRRVLHGRTPTDPEVPDDAMHVVKETFRIGEGPFQGLRGQLALGAEGQRTGQRPTSIRIYIEGRHIDTLTIDRDKLPAAMDAAIAWDGRLRPKFSYEGVVDDDDLRLAIFQLTRLTLVALGTYLERSVQEKRSVEERSRVLPLVRAAIGNYVVAAKALGLEKLPEEPAISAYSSIWTRGTWTAANPNRLPVSLAELKTYSDRTKAICYVAPGTTGTAPDDRPVVVVTNLEKEWLSLVFPGVTMIPYERGLRRPNAAVAPGAFLDLLHSAQSGKHAAGEMLPAMTFESSGGRGAIAVGLEDRCLSLHAGVLLATESMQRFVEPATIVLEHDATIPKPAWDGVFWSKEMSSLVHVRNEFLEKIVEALEGNAEARRSLRGFPTEPGPVFRSFLIEAVARFRTKELAGRIEKFPLVYVLDEEGRPRLSTLADVAARFPDQNTIPFLREAPSFPTFDWGPLLLRHDREVAALLRWAGNRVKAADDELERHYKRAQVETRKRAFLQKPQLRFDEAGALADPDVPIKVWQEQPKDSGEGVAFVVVGLPRTGLDLPLATVEILYEGRLVCSRPLLGLPVSVVARVALPSNDALVDFVDVSPAGLTQIEAFVYSAACVFAADLVSRAEGPACEAFFQDRRRLLLIQQLFACSATNPSRSDILTADFALRAAGFLWPTVQGDWRPYSELAPGGKKLYYATARYVSWEKSARGFSELDAPIVHLPPTTEGNLMREILAVMGHEMQDVSSAVYALQSRRKPGSGHGGPTLSGSPVHAALRASLSSIGLDLEGELELTDGSDIRVDVETLHGAVVKLDVTAPVAFRAVVRVEDVELDADEKKHIAEKLAKGAVKHIESLGLRLDELPPFIRLALRTVIVKNARKGRTLSKRRQMFEVFPDVSGHYHSIADLRDSGDSAYPYVMFVPTLPMTRRARSPLCITSDEAHILSNVLTLEDVTDRLRREAEAESRKHAAPLSFIGLSASQRLECLDIVPFEGDVVEGEIGVLSPENADKRGIWVHKTRRTLCKLGDTGDWPVLAVINDDSIPENKTFDGIKGNPPKEKLRKAVEARVEAVISKWCIASDNVLAARKVRKRLLNDAVVVVGVLWLPPSWLTAGPIEVRDGSNRFPTPRTFGGPNHPERVDVEIPVPVSGRLFIANTGASKKPQEITAALSAWLLEETTALVREAQAAQKDARVVDGYRWILKFFGADVGKLDAHAADGRMIDAAEVVKTLRTKKEIWVSAKDATIEGVFPGETPPFILRGEGQALVDVLRARTNFIRELAAVEKPIEVEKVQAVRDVASFHFDKQIQNGAKPLPPPTIVPDPEDVASDPAPVAEPAGSWFRNLVQRVVVFFDRPEVLAPWTKDFGPSLVLTIDKLGLTPTCVVTGVRYVRRGRPMVFEESSGVLVINQAHEGVHSLAARASRDPRARLLLVVLAVREINRVLEIVTDATEKRVLLALLRGESL